MTHQHAQIVLDKPTAPVIDSWKMLMVAVIQQAVEDLTAKDPQRAMGAALFFTGEDWGLWAEAVGTPERDGVQFLTSGQARRAKTFLRRRSERRSRLPVPV